MECWARIANSRPVFRTRVGSGSRSARAQQGLSRAEQFMPGVIKELTNN